MFLVPFLFKCWSYLVSFSLFLQLSFIFLHLLFIIIFHWNDPENQIKDNFILSFFSLLSCDIFNACKSRSTKWKTNLWSIFLHKNEINFNKTRMSFQIIRLSSCSSSWKGTWINWISNIFKNVVSIRLKSTRLLIQLWYHLASTSKQSINFRKFERKIQF